MPPDDNASYMLVSWAKQFTNILLEICRTEKLRIKLPKDEFCKAGEIATRLQMVCPYIESLPHYWIDDDVDQLCREMMKKLVVICLWPAKVQIRPGFTVADCNYRLAGQSRSGMKHSIFNYFLENSNGVEKFSDDCSLLYKTLAPTSAEESTAPPSNLQSMALYDHSKHNHALFETVQEHCHCLPNLHVVPGAEMAWHPARLCLEGDSSGASFGIMVSLMDMSTWQEFRLSVSDEASPGEALQAECLIHGQFCTFLESPPFARILFSFKPGLGLFQLPKLEVQQLNPAGGRGESLASILRNYQLTPRDKVMLSYSVARTYWQFYDSDLMKTKWSSETISFMPTANNHGQADQLPLRAFVSFPFNVPDHTPEDFIHDLKIPLHHRCPRIFALGILLLEIGLGRPFPTRVFKNLTSQVNFDYTTATNLLETLRKTKWDGFNHMRYFIDAVEYCIDGGNFIRDTSDPASPYHDHQRSKDSNEEKSVEKRRRSLYHMVVQPLAWLAIKGFKSNSSGITYLNKIPDPKPLNYTRSGFSDGKRQEGGFHNAQPAGGSWLEKLKGISFLVDKRRKKHNITTPINVAILDTGIDIDMPFYLDEDDGEDRKGQIEVFKDFIGDPDDPSKAVDYFGHGSLMARLVADATPFESAPFTKLMVARVAKSTEELPKRQDTIAEAIRWAGKQGANIISMSFGFPRDHKAIAQAIEDVSNEYGVVFLASAGNAPDEDETFPARHPNVISIYATNRYGTFSESNSRRPRNRSEIFGTFSDSIPPEIVSEFDREFRDVCQPGSSVATAVAAGIAAVTMAYVQVLPKLIPSPPSSEMKRALQRIQGSRGMAAVFRAMAQDKSDDRWFINPRQFWRLKNQDEARYNAISSCLWDVDRALQ